MRTNLLLLSGGSWGGSQTTGNLYRWAMIHFGRELTRWFYSQLSTITPTPQNSGGIFQVQFSRKVRRKSTETVSVVVSRLTGKRRSKKKKLSILEDPIGSGPSNLCRYYEYDMRYEEGMKREHEK